MAKALTRQQRGGMITQASAVQLLLHPQVRSARSAAFGHKDTQSGLCLARGVTCDCRQEMPKCYVDVDEGAWGRTVGSQACPRVTLSDPNSHLRKADRGCLQITFSNAESCTGDTASQGLVGATLCTHRFDSETGLDAVTSASAGGNSPQLPHVPIWRPSDRAQRLISCWTRGGT